MTTLVKNCLAIICMLTLIPLLLYFGKQAAMNMYRAIDERRYPEYYQAIAPIEAERNTLNDWFLSQIRNIPDTVTNPNKYKNLLKILWRACDDVYSSRIRKYEVQLKKYSGNKAEKVDLEKLAKKKPLEFIEYLWAFDSIAHDNITRKVFDSEYRSNFDRTYIDLLTHTVISGVFLDKATFEFIEAIIPDNHYIKLLKERQALLDFKGECK